MTRGSVLIVEDEPMIALFLEDVCDMADVDVVGIVGTVSAALDAVVLNNYNAVILDVNLQGETSEPIAELLGKMGKNVIVSTGSYAGELPDVYQNFTIIQKPMSINDLTLVLTQLAF